MAVREALQLGHGADLAAEEGRQVARHRRVLRIRQAQLRQCGAHAADRPRRGFDGGKEAVEDRCRDLFARERRCGSSRRSACCRGWARRSAARARPHRQAASPSLRGRRGSARAAAMQSSVVPAAASLRATTCASARSMLSPPSRMCSPTATRCSSRLPSRSSTAMSEKSLVPPPTSTTRMMSPAAPACARRRRPSWIQL